jgi:tyrosine-protein kinase Etk/Wzc
MSPNRQNGTAAPAASATPSTTDLGLREVFLLVRRNLWLILVVAAVVIGGTAWITWHTQPVYQAAATVHVDQERSSSLPELGYLTTMLRGSDLATEMALLKARSVAEVVVDSLNLQVRVTDPVGRSRVSLFSALDATQSTSNGDYTFERANDQYRITDEQGRVVGTVAPGEAIVFNGVRLVLASDPRDPLPARFHIDMMPYEDAVQDLMDRLSVDRISRDANVISVSYTGNDPVEVAQVPNMVGSVFIASRSASKKTEATSTVKFLREQIATYTDQLRDAEEGLLAFQQGSQVVNLQAEGAEQVKRLVDQQAERDRVAGELQNLSGILAEIDKAPTNRPPGTPSPYRRLAAFPTFFQTQSITDLMSKLNNLETQYTDMGSRRKPDHPEMIALKQQIDQLETQLYQTAVNYRNTLTSQLAGLDQRLSQFNGQLERIPQKALQQARLERQKTALEQVFTLLQSRLKEAEIAQAVEPGDVRVVDQAIAPTRPIRPRKTRSMALAVVFGLILGIAVAGVKDYMDETVHSREDLTRIANIPVLAMIPRIKGAGKGAGGLLRKQMPLESRLVTRNDAGSPVSEAYRAFRTNITFLNIEKPAQLLVLTSPGPSEGKSTTVVNLAITLAQQNTRTLVVDCDLRRGIVHKIFGEQSARPGLTNVLMKECTLDDAVRAADLGGGQELYILPTGTLPPNPSELLGSKQMRNLMLELRGKFDMILLDSPPLNLVTDAAVLGAEADGVIVIARAGATDKSALRYAVDQLRAVKAHLSGTVLNDLDYSGRARYYGTGYGYGYYHRYYRQEEKVSS